MLAAKIDADLRWNLLFLYWDFLWTLASVSFLPMIVQTAVAQALAARGDRRFRFFLHYLELAVPLTILVSTGTWFVRGSLSASREPAALWLFALLAWAVVTGLFADQILHRRMGWWRFLLGGWLLAGLILLIAYVPAAFVNIAESGMGNGPRQLVWILLMVTAVGVGCYGVFGGRLRWYIRLGIYLGLTIPLVLFIRWFPLT